MPKELRIRLTGQFVLLFVLLYFFGGALAMYMFDQNLTKALDYELRDLSEEILPSIEYRQTGPTLKAWADRAAKQHYSLPGTIQLYDEKAKLLERYGPPGASVLWNGTVKSGHGAGSVRSLYVGVGDRASRAGYLQIQVSTSHRDDAVYGMITTMILIAPVLALAVAVCGSWFSGKAVQPVETTVQLLRRFVADAGHEINTPITVIEASVQTLEETFREEGLPTDVLEIIKRASGRMRELGDSLLMLARMETPHLVSPKVALNLKAIVSPVMEECSQIAKSKNILLECGEIPEQVIVGHAEALQRMLQNLLANALRYTDNDGRVTLSVQAESRWVLMQVEDTGIGIPPESLPHIFERFYCVDKSRSRTAGGSGLGLSIVKAIVDNHSGIISVSSQLGHGSIFSVKLPIDGGTDSAASSPGST